MKIDQIDEPERLQPFIDNTQEFEVIESTTEHTFEIRFIIKVAVITTAFMLLAGTFIVASPDWLWLPEYEQQRGGSVITVVLVTVFMWFMKRIQ